MEAADSKSLAVRTIDKGGFSAIEQPMRQVVTNRAQFNDLWAKHSSRREPTPPAPEVDFDKETVLWVSAGRKNSGGYGVNILKVEEHDSGLVAKLAVTSPKKGAMTIQVLTAPFHIAAIPKTTKSIKFEELTPVEKPGSADKRTDAN